MKYVLFFLLFVSLSAFAQEGINPDSPEKYEDSVYQIVDEKATFPGGMNEMYAWIAKNTVYPTMAIEKNIQGKVYVSFVIEKDGTTSKIAIERGVHPTLDIEAIRLIKTMPKWKPATING